MLLIALEKMQAITSKTADKIVIQYRLVGNPASLLQKGENTMQNTNIVATYDYYTLDQARQIISEENRQKAIRRAERKARKKAETIYYIKQKLSGLTMAAIGIITPILLDGDATFSLIALPVGIWLLFTKEKVMMF